MLSKKDRHSFFVNQHELVYYRCGQGEPLLFIHGITTYSFIWRNLVPLLENKYELIIIDLLGCGDSEKTIDIDFSLRSHAQIISKFLSELHIEKVHLVGHDVGGGICQIMAVRYPEQIFSLTLMNTVAYDFWPVQPIISMRTPIIRQLAMASLDLGAFKFIVKRGMYHSERLTRELLDLFWYPMKTREGRKAFLYFSHCLNNKDLLELSDDINKLVIPVLIIRGDKDVYLSKLISEKLHRNIKSSRLKVIANAGHFIQEDVPQQLVEHLHSFIDNIHESK